MKKMSQGVTIDISARITGYEKSLEQLRSALTKLNPGSEIAKSITKALEVAEGKVKDLSKNLTPKVSSDSQLDRLTDKVNGAGDAIQRVANLMQNITSDDVNFDSFGDSIEEVNRQVQTLQKVLDETFAKGFKDFINDTDEIKQAFEELQIETKDKGKDDIFSALAEKAKEAKKETETATKVLEQAQKKLSSEEGKLANLKANPLNDKQKLTEDLKQITAEYTNAIFSIQKQVAAGLASSDLGFNQKTQDDILGKFMGGLTPQNLKERLDNLKQQVMENLQSAGKSIKVTDLTQIL